MAKENAIQPVEETVKPTVKVKSEPVTEIVLKQGQAAVTLADSNDENDVFITSISDWNRVYSKSEKDGKPVFKLLAEKKS